MTQNKRLGQWAEQQAFIYLQENGYCLVVRNYHSRFGEIDLVVKKHNELIFVEVKARSKTTYGLANEVVSWSKQKKMIKTAMVFLAEFPEFEQFYVRFDVICFDFLQQFAKTIQQDFSKFNYDLNWIENAFTFDSEFINL